LSFLLLLMFSFALIGGFFYYVVQLFNQLTLSPDTRAWRAALDKLRARLKAMPGGALIPWESETLSLLSFNRGYVKKAGFWNNVSEGVFTTIYQEPVVAYAMQKAGSAGVIMARTADREFVFRIKGKETEIWINEQPFGILVDGALLSAGRNSKLMGRLDWKSDLAQNPVLLGDNTAAALANPGMNTSPNPRAVFLLRDLKPEEENALLAMAILQMLK
jgi:hypothetical protein